MRLPILTVGTCVAVVSSSVPLSGQLRSAQTVVDDLRDGQLDRPELLIFEGCPQEDPVGRAVFDAVRGFDLAGRQAVTAAVYLASAGVAYPGCGYGPLDQWMVETVRRLQRAQDFGALLSFARRLGPEMPLELKDAFLDAAEDVAFPPPAAVELANTVFSKRPVHTQVSEAIKAFRRPLPLEWKQFVTLQLVRSQRSEFLAALAAEEGTLDDDTFFVVTGAIGTEVRDGRLAPDTPGLELVRSKLDSRPDVPAAARIPRGGE